MAGTVISAVYPPLVDPTRATLAYGRGALPRLNRELKDENLLTCQRATMSLADYLHDPEHIAAAIREGIIESLNNLLCNCDSTIRQKSVESLHAIACHANGREALVEKKSIQKLALLLDDCDDVVRKNVHMTFEKAALSFAVIDEMIACCLITLFISKIGVEPKEIQHLILDTLHSVFKVDVGDALGSGAMYAFRECLSSSLDSIRMKGARNIADICQVLEGKNQAVECKVMDYLIKLLYDSKADVRTQAVNAIMRIAITKQGKYTIIEVGGMPRLLELLSSDPYTELQVNCLKAITCLAEAPEGRAYFLTHISKIEICLGHRLPAIKKATKIALSVINWKP